MLKIKLYMIWYKCTYTLFIRCNIGFVIVVLFVKKTFSVMISHQIFAKFYHFLSIYSKLEFSGFKVMNPKMPLCKITNDNITQSFYQSIDRLCSYYVDLMEFCGVELILKERFFIDLQVNDLCGH